MKVQCEWLNVSFFNCLQHKVFAESEVVIHAFSRPRNGRTDRQTGGQSTGQTRLLNPAVRMGAVELKIIRDCVS